MITQKIKTALMLAALAFAGQLSATKTTADKPNVILILADDLGWGDVSCNNPESKIQTPNVDKLAAQGIRFTDGHSSSAQCSPTRYGLLTGRYSWRTRLKSQVLKHFDTPLIERDEFTLAELFKQNDYATACIGKWHLGLGWQAKEGRTFKPDSWNTKQIDAIDFTKALTDSPVDHGFDYFWGQNASNNMLPYCYVENNRVVQIPTERKKPVFETEDGHGLRSPDYFSADIDQKNWEQIEKWLKKQTDDKPFFLYYPMSAIHLPCLPTKKFIGSSKGGLRGDKTVEMDDILGRIMNWLDETGKADNTIVIFTSDNGHAEYGDSVKNLRMLANNSFGKIYNPDKLLKLKPEKGNITYGHKPGGPFRGKKIEVNEGGHRVPFIVRWPSRIKAGTVSDKLVSTLDFMKTFAAILETDLPAGASPDGADVLPVWLGEQSATGRSNLVSKGWGPNDLAIRQGDWKLITYNTISRESSVTNIKGQFLYNLKNDPGERTNLADQYPEKVATLKALLDKIRHRRISSQAAPGKNGKTQKVAAKLDWSKVKTGDVYASGSAPAMVKKAFKISGEMEVAADAKHVVLAHGGTAVGYTLYLNGGELVFAVSTGKKHLERVSTSAPAGKFSFAAGMDDKGHLFVQVGDSEAVSSQTGGHWISKWPAEDLSVGFDYGHAVDPKSPKEKFKGKLLKLEVK